MKFIMLHQINTNLGYIIIRNMLNCVRITSLSNSSGNLLSYQEDVRGKFVGQIYKILIMFFRDNQNMMFIYRSFANYCVTKFIVINDYVFIFKITKCAIGFIHKKFSSPKMRNREFVFAPKIEYQLVAERSEANQSSLTFPFWCAREESNLQPLVPETNILSIELRAL